MLAELDQVKKQYKDLPLINCFWALFSRSPEKYGFLEKTEKICQKMTEESLVLFFRTAFFPDT